MVEEFACPHCGKNLGSSQSPANATLMCPYCQQFFTMAGGGETPPPEVKHHEPKPAETKSSEVGASKIDSPKTDAGDLGAAPSTQTRRAPSVLEPSTKPELLGIDKSSSSISSASLPNVTDNVAGESDSLKAIAPEDRAAKTSGSMADAMGSSDRESIETERISTSPAPLPRPADGSVVSPYIIPPLPRKTAASIVGISIMIAGGVGLLASLLLAIIFTGDNNEVKFVTDNFQPVIVQMDNFQTSLKEITKVEFIESFAFELIVAGCLVFISLAVLWSGDGIRHKKKSAWIALILLVVIVTGGAILADVPPLVLR